MYDNTAFEKKLYSPLMENPMLSGQTLPLNTQIDALLTQRFGFTEFRAGQREAIETLLRDNSLLCILPTGHGKSLLYQLPAVLIDGITLVISPLLALMRDQAEQLTNRFHIPAASINSDNTNEENDRVRHEVRSNDIKILFVAPEQLDNLETFSFLLSLPIGLVVVDEAHCVSTWGHDFRPSYRRIITALKHFNQQRPSLYVLALTATANRRTEADIAQQLQFPGRRPLQIHRASLQRTNIALSVVELRGMAAKLATLCQVIKPEETTLIYCATRENVELVSKYLCHAGYPAAFYHAGIDSEAKQCLQREFFTGERTLLAATNALGMGIDKRDVRLIVHFDVPGSITAYYQEVGRAGRDGAPSRGVLLFDPADSRIQSHFIASAQPSEEDFAGVLACLDIKEEAPTLTEVKSLSGLHPTLVVVILAELMEQGHVAKELVGRRQVYRRTALNKAPDLSRYKEQLHTKKEELRLMLEYGEATTFCRMHYLCSLLGDPAEKPCGKCDYCLSETSAAPLSLEAVSKIDQWLLNQPCPISGYKPSGLGEGVAVLDGSVRTQLFVEFMRTRRESTSLRAEIMNRLIQFVRSLHETHKFIAVLPLPSRTWLGRNQTTQAIANSLGIRALPEALMWREDPAARQGELLNNDQRRINVKARMEVNSSIVLPKGPLLLLDDYVGSGVTLQEAARAVRSARGKSASTLIPITVARVKWKLGSPGMI